MTADEVAAFLAEPHKLQLATINADGTPHLVTMYYDVVGGAGDHDGGGRPRIAFWTYATSRKAANLRRDPRLTCLVEAGDGYDQLRGVMVTGTAVLVTAPDDVLAIGRRVYGRYVDGGPAGIAALEPFLAQQAAKRVGVLVDVAEVVSWDHRKLVAAAAT